MNISNIIEKYLLEIESIKRYSENTLRAYGKDLRDFKDYCIKYDKIDIGSISEKFIKSYLMILSDKELDKRSISRKLASLRSMFRFAYQNNFIENNPLTFILNPKTVRKLPEIVSTDLILHIYELADGEEEKPELVQIIFELLYGCALRVSELCNIRYLDLSFEKSQIRIIGKGNKTRIVPVGSKSLVVVNNYLKLNPIENSNDYLIRSKKNEKLYPKLVYRIVNKYLSKVSDIKKKSPHILRHSAATHMLDNGADLRAVKEILGHENLSTTQIYTHVSIERLKSTYKKSHPKS
jgi:site-specific recombinase XerD